jgi:hypothetical protein
MAKSVQHLLWIVPRPSNPISVHLHLHQLAVGLLQQDVLTRNAIELAEFVVTRHAETMSEQKGKGLAARGGTDAKVASTIVRSGSHPLGALARPNNVLPLCGIAPIREL